VRTPPKHNVKWRRVRSCGLSMLSRHPATSWDSKPLASSSAGISFLRCFSIIGSKDPDALKIHDYITPKDMLAGRHQEIHSERDRKLAAARQQRQVRRKQAA
jgi:hypothetical protein